jgi:hypothetical protein
MLCGMTSVQELFESAVDARRVARNAIAAAVREARGAGWSWDRISAALGGTPNGETLRRNFGAADWLSEVGRSPASEGPGRIAGQSAAQARP